MRKLVAPAVAFAVFGVGQSISGWQSPLIGVALMVAGALLGLAALVVWLRPRWAWVDRCFNYLGASPIVPATVRDDGALSRAEIVERLTRHRDRAKELALSPKVDTWSYEQCRDVADANETEAGTAIHVLCPEHAQYWPENRMMYDPAHPPATMQAHFRDRMRYTATQIDMVIAELRASADFNGDDWVSRR